MVWLSNKEFIEPDRVNTRMEGFRARGMANKQRWCAHAWLTWVSKPFPRGLVLPLLTARVLAERSPYLDRRMRAEVFDNNPQSKPSILSTRKIGIIIGSYVCGWASVIRKKIDVL